MNQQIGCKENPSESRQEENELVRQYQNGRMEALHTLIERNRGYIVKVAMEYCQTGMSMEDLVNEGKLGLIEAARRYDPEKGNRFITYAIWWIRKTIISEVCNSSRVVRIPGYRWRMEKRKNAGSTSALYPREVSLDEKRGKNEDRSSNDMLEDWRNPDPETSFLRQETGRLLGEAITHLTDQERHVISCRFGLNDEQPRILKEIGEEMGISRERVRQIEEQAKRRLKRILARNSWATTGPAGSSSRRAATLRVAAY
jgi:RNA polymerase primary sigma factor